MKLIDADKFLAYLIISKHIDELTCGEVKQAIEMCKVDVDDAVSRQAVIGIIKRNCIPLPNTIKLLDELPSVLPKCEENTVSEEVYTKEYTRRKALEYENYVLKQNMQALRCGNEVK